MSVPAERRRNERFEIRLDGRVELADGCKHDCLVLDYCSGGMLVRRTQPGTEVADCGYQRGQRLQVTTKLLARNGMRAIKVGGRVAWVRGEHFGMAFDRATDSVFRALQLHDSLARGHTAEQPAQSALGGTQGQARLRQFAQGALPAMLRDLLVKVGEDLLEAADVVTSDSERQQIYGDITAIDKAREGDSLTCAVISAAFDSKADAEQDPEPAGGELSLVDPDDFERWLEASRVANLLDRRFGERLGAIASRLAGMHGSAPSGSLTVPFEPKHFTFPLKDLAREIELSAIARKVLFDRADALFAEKLTEFYNGVDDVLDAVGAPAARRENRLKVPRPNRSGGSHTPDRADGEVKITDAVEQAAAGAGLDTRTAGPALTQGYITAHGHGGAVAMDPVLVEQMARREAKHREGLAQELMSFIGEAPNMTESLTGWMQMLSAPLAREAAADHEFFQNKQHPLREIVDGLGHLQLFRANPDMDSSEDPVRAQVSELLRPIEEGESDPEVLRSIAQALGELSSRQSRTYQRNVERVVEASEGRDRVRRARGEVSTEIRRRYAGRQVPGVVPQLLEVGWRAVLELAAINAFEGDTGYAIHLGLLDSVVAALGGEAFEPEPSEPDADRLIERIEKELGSVAFDPFRRDAVETRLRKELMNPELAGVELVSMSLPEDEAEDRAADACPEGVSEAVWASLLQRCAEIELGARVLMSGDGDGEKELRVAWIRVDREVFVLVDHRGLRARYLQLAELALGLHEKRIAVEQPDGRPLSDRAVDSILVRMEERLAHQANHDALTGLINRQQFHSAVQKALDAPAGSGDPGVLLLLDIDQFRLVNDVRGYETGDRLLVAVAKLLEGVTGAKVLGHMGGDRFALMLPDIGLADGDQRAQEICGLLREMPFDWFGQAISLSSSIGVVSMGIGHEGMGDLLQAADDALAAAKAAGGDRVYVYDEEDPEITRRKESVHWVVQVDEALDRGHLRLRCQPIVPVKPGSGLQPHYEVLLGVHNATSEPLPIAEFIDAAERYNRMRAVDRWVARTAMEWIAAHRDQMPLLHGFAVNLSGQTASDPSFVDFVREQFQHTGIDPAWLSFEVTETAAVSDLSSSAGIIQDLKSMGCKVALDDFGSGLASYSYLKELPVDWLKIDGVFVRKIAESREDLAVVKSINEIGQFLGKQTIAEYVGDDKILRLIRAIGVDFAQGFGISPPLFMDELVQTLEAATG